MQMSRLTFSSKWSETEKCIVVSDIGKVRLKTSQTHFIFIPIFLYYFSDFLDKKYCDFMRTNRLHKENHTSCYTESVHSIGGKFLWWIFRCKLTQHSGFHVLVKYLERWKGPYVSWMAGRVLTHSSHCLYKLGPPGRDFLSHNIKLLLHFHGISKLAK